MSALCALTFLYLYNMFAYWGRMTFNLMVIAGIGAGTLALVWSSVSTAGTVRPIDLPSPLRGGSFYVVQGGSNAIVNNHRLGRVRIPAQKFALDLTMLSPAGRRSKLMGSRTELSTYHIFGQPVHAPCRGTIVRVVSSFYNTPVSNRRAPAGNYVAIGCRIGVTVTLAHLDPDIRVVAGEPVEEGGIVGFVGSTGYTSEPHLHIHAVEGIQLRERFILFTGTAVPMRIDGTIPYKNQVLDEG